MKYISKFLSIIATVVVVALGLVGVSTSATAVTPSATTSSAVVAGDQPEPAVQVVKLSAKTVQKATKLVKCLSRASKREQPVRPADPLSLCKNKVKVKVVAVASAKCPNADVGAKGKVVIRQRVLATALAQSVVPGNARTRAKTVIDDLVKGSAKAWVTCPATVTPTPTPAPQILEVESVNFVLEKNTRTIAVTGKVASGHTANLFATADNGGTIVANKSVTVSGSFTVKVTYMAPAEIPPANSQKGVPQGHDRVTFILTQDDGQSVSDSTNLFEIRPAPVDPL